MKTVMINKPNDLQIIEMDKPVITEHDNVLIKMKAAGICGSDVHIYHGQNAAATYPRVIGHEMVGEVVEVGSNATKIKAGDRVIVDQVVNCGECYACRKGRGNVCANLKVRGVHIHGGYREYIAVPESDVYILPDNLSYEDAVMIEPATIAVQSCSRAELTKEDTLLILGCGALGSSILKIARLSGATIIAVDVVDEKIEEAKKNDATYGINLLKEDVVARARELTGGYGPTVSIDAACTKDSLATLLDLTGNAGRVITMGFSVEPTAVTQFKITAKELDVRGSRLQNKKFQEVLNLVAEGKLDLTNSISHKFNFLDAQKAFDFVDSRDPSIRKIVLTFDN
ncbi:zinc-binding alcohol dehydrogenase family protein [Clostridium beijerinckii]|uniref:L-gulonate 5-dehydrogenase n=1 Tax=Clostridium beijerinckii TaxID=1520 RepID=A0A9Q5GIJ5_CLOBE|nr:zinc-binding alcohol dehydrogenase family protein [Clostridium beijerinckii]AQS06203.1 putative zinc-type alcohol dehydrogenase-like protein YjmD [Clostridium beijerinckii]MBA2886240.1 L-gulonate 5-dehydrogenase [Clostridium beijerinckii]MBA2900902.1 L-gulonate 5-dehydrogenase [Clostridium beijerinckii]MBA2910799.1 L-gulonate 5-dehydrogenase [Clostridium beijerinckii]MBA9014190.1 L-gulonate 5-dehydrogenase [Clostridium beijerinckii]